MNMKSHEVIEKAGGTAAVSEALGVPRKTVQKWLERGIPMRYALRLSVISGVPLTHIRPDMAA